MLLSANIFQPLISVFQHVITFFHKDVGLSWGWAIVSLTVCVRLVLMPLTVKQFQSMRRLQSHQPEMKAIQQKYKDDKQLQQQEMMRFYQENNVNPFASCLPLLLQFPVFMSLYYMLRKNLRNDICPDTQTAARVHYAAEHGVSVAKAASHTVACGHVPEASFLFLKDITATATGVPLIILLVLYVGTQFLSMWLMQQPGMDKGPQRAMMVMPLFFVIFIIKFPAGLMVYWITTNLWTVGQGVVMKYWLGPPLSVAVSTSGGDSGYMIESDTEQGTRRSRGASGSAATKQGFGSKLIGRMAQASAAPEKKNAEGRSVKSAKDSKDSGSPGDATQKSGRVGSATPPPPPRKKKKRSGRRR